MAEREELDTLFSIWRWNADQMVCRYCGRAIHVTRHGERLNHVHGCPNADAPNPWATLAALLSPPAAAQEHLDRIAKFLNLERERGSYWLPAEPGPIECGSIAEAVEQFAHLADNEHRRAAAAAQEIERLRAALKGLMPYRAHLRGCEVDMTEFCTCGLRERVDTARRALTLEARNGQ